MSATISRPTTGHKSAAPFGAVAILAGVVALGAIGVAYGQSLKAAPAAGVPADVQAAMIAQRAGERASLETARDPRLTVATTELQDRLTGAAVAADPRLLVGQSEVRERIAGDVVPPTFPGKETDDFTARSNEALFAARYNSAPSVAGASIDSEALFAARYSSAPSYTGASLAQDEALFAARYNSAPSFVQPLSITGTGTGPQTAAQKGLVGMDRWSVLAADKYAQAQMSRTIVQEQPLRAHPARHPVAN